MRRSSSSVCVLVTSLRLSRALFSGQSVRSKRLVRRRLAHNLFQPSSKKKQCCVGVPMRHNTATQVMFAAALAQWKVSMCLRGNTFKCYLPDPYVAAGRIATHCACTGPIPRGAARPHLPWRSPPTTTRTNASVRPLRSPTTASPLPRRCTTPTLPRTKCTAQTSPPEACTSPRRVHYADPSPRKSYYNDPPGAPLEHLQQRRAPTSTPYHTCQPRQFQQTGRLCVADASVQPHPCVQGTRHDVQRAYTALRIFEQSDPSAPFV